MTKNRIFLLLLCVLLAIPGLSGIFAGTQAPQSGNSFTDREKQKELSGISRLTVSCITRLHYNAAPLDPKKAEMAFLEYLKFLDPMKVYLTQQDIDGFSKDPKAFVNSFASGDLQLAVEMYQLVRQRQKEYCDYGEKLLQNLPADFFAGNDTYRIDRKTAAWQSKPADLLPLWEKRLKNELIVLTLSDRAIEQEIEKKKEAKEKDLPEKPKKNAKERLKQRLDYQRRIGDEMEPIDVAEMFLNSIAAVYDPHTSYLSPVTDEDFNISMSLKLSGIGAVLTTEDDYTKIVEVMPGGPADKDGRLQAGDRIIAVAQADGEAEDIIGMPLQKVVRKIRGPVGTKVTLTVLQAKNGGVNSVPVKITLTRAEVMVKDSEAKGEVRTVRDENGNEQKLGVISLPSFYLDFEAASQGDPNYKCASRDVRNILLDFRKQGVDGVILDLRSNGGGSLADVVTLCGLFIGQGPMVQVRSRNSTETLDDEDGGQVVYDKPMIVLVNRLSASASEIFAGAIRDYGRGIVVGDSKTHGKGTVQTVKHLDPMMPFMVGKKIKGGSVKITIAKFYRVNGESTQLKGVTPDVIFPSFFDVMDLGEDKLDNPLPWDTIVPARFRKVKGAEALEAMIPELQKRSAARVAENKDFRMLNVDIARFKKIQDQKDVSLNLEDRWISYQDDKKVEEEQRKMFKLDGDSKDGKKKKEKDIYLEECLNILQDMITLKSNQSFQ
ncbi:MAG: carboxy terminal-processing peptidase [Lentisphaeria bacterium]|nr:carboxy terminal-processing peptidase [Lentisphaeria bacterium]